MLALRTLGAISLENPSGEEISGLLAQPKRFGLFSYLLLFRRPGYLRRSTLLSVFWRNRNERDARNSLSQALTFLRKHLPEGAVVTRGTEEVRIFIDPIEVDVFRFRSAVDQGQWAEALDLYRGDFLSGFHISDAWDFNEWVEAERERLKESAARAAWALAQEQVERGALYEAERAARRAVDLVCTDEAPVRRFVESLAVAGDRAAAVHFFLRFGERLRRKLELDPSGGMTEFIERVKKGDLEAAGEEPLPSSSP